MARRRIGSNFRRDFVQRRSSVWIPLAPGQNSAGAASTAVVIGSLNAVALALRPFTVVRTRGSVLFRSDQSAASESYGGGFGAAVVSDQAVAIGVTAVPTPVTDFDSDLWFMIEQFFGRFDFADATGSREVGRTMQIDSKAMRKVDQGQDIVIALETSSISSSMVLDSALRFLLKLH